MSRSVLKLFVLAALALVVIFAWRWSNRHSVPQMTGKIARELPLGSSKSQVVGWLNANHLTYEFTCWDNSHKNADGSYKDKHHKDHDLFIRVQTPIRSIACSYATDLRFAFDARDRLIRVGVSENSVCL